MKNAIIATLSLALIFFVLYSLGAFDAGELVDRNYRGHFARERERHVAKSENWLLGYTYAEGSDISEATVAGLHFAADSVNAKGGVLGKPVRLLGKATERVPMAQARVVQFFCDNFHVAAYFGPAYTVGVPAVRALSQFQGLPLISPLTLKNPVLPKLEPDNYVPLLAPVSLWAKAITDQLRDMGAKRVLVIGPGEQASYGELFANACERAARRDLTEAEVFRYNYDVNIADSAAFSHVIDLYRKNRGLDAVVYAGDWETLPLLNEALKSEKLHIPVFGSDVLYKNDETDIPLFDFPLYIPELVTKSMTGDLGRAWREKFGCEPTYWNFMGALAVYLTCKAIEEDGGYDTKKLPASARKLAETFWREEAPQVRLRIVPMPSPDPGGDARAQTAKAGGDGAGKLSANGPNAAQKLEETTHAD